MTSPRTPNGDDRRVGAELRAMREAAGIRQEDAAAKIGVSMQQYGKYERGENRISAARFDEMRKVFREHGGQAGMAEEGAAYDAGGDLRLDDIRHDLERIKSDVDRVLKRLGNR